MKKNLQALIEAIIAGDTKAAEKHLHAYLTAKTRSLLEGDDEKSEDSDKDEKDSEKKDDDKKSDDKEEKKSEDKDDDKKDEDKDSDEKKDEDKKDDDKKSEKVDESMKLRKGRRTDKASKSRLRRKK